MYNNIRSSNGLFSVIQKGGQPLIFKGYVRNLVVTWYATCSNSNLFKERAQYWAKVTSIESHSFAIVSYERPTSVWFTTCLNFNYTNNIDILLYASQSGGLMSLASREARSARTISIIVMWSAVLLFKMAVHDRREPWNEVYETESKFKAILFEVQKSIWCWRK